MIEGEAKHFGGWLTGREIESCVASGRLVIEPFSKAQVNPNSYNYRLYDKIRRIKNDVIDLRGEESYEEITLSEEGTTLYPGECYLGCTFERMGSPYYASLITGRSSIGRKFVTNHITAGLVDVGFVGRITLEITVAKPTIFYPNLLFGQIYWFTTVGELAGYVGRYQAQEEPTLSKMHADFVQGN